MSKEGKHGVSTKTPKNILFGAGTIHKNLQKVDGEYNYHDISTVVGATSGGSKISIVPEVTLIEIDGALVAAKGLDAKTGETATMEVNLIELSADIIRAAAIGTVSASKDAGYSIIEPKPNIEEGDYWENIAFVGLTLDGKYIVVVMENALCTSGFEPEGKNKEGAVGKYTFRCSAELESDLDTLPWHIYYPEEYKAPATETQSNEEVAAEG